MEKKNVSNIKVSYCKDCKGDFSATIEHNESIDSIEKLGSAVGVYGEFSQMSFVENETFEKEVEARGLGVKTMSYYDYEDCHNVFECGCTEMCKRVKTFEDACSVLGISAHVPYFGNVPEKLKIQLVAHYKISIITHVLNEGKEINHLNTEHRGSDVFYPSGFWNPKDESDSGFCSWPSDDFERSPGILCYFFDTSIAEYAGNQFRELYHELYQYPDGYLDTTPTPEK